MTSKMACLGPPGTGKTSWGMKLVQEWVRLGVRVSQVAYLAFTKAAANEAASRVADGRFEGEDFPYFRTLHSLCLRLMREDGVDCRVMTAKDMKQFGMETGLAGEYAVQSNEDLAEAYQSLNIESQGIWDNCRTAYTLSRISSRSIDELDRARVEISDDAIRRMGWGDAEAYRTFVGRYEAFKKTRGLVDFTDMLEYPIRHAVSVPCRKVIVDECQDLCPLHFSIIDRVFNGPAEEIWYIGDDDQAVFGFSGASAEEFLVQIGTAKKVVLRQTHRFGQGIVDFSERIIQRVKNRIVKDVIGKPGAECVISEAGSFEVPEGESFVLHRHVRGCQEIGARLIAAGEPFTSERGRSPLSNANRIKAFKALKELSEGQKTYFGSARILIEDLLPSFWALPDGSQKLRLIVHGAKKRLQEMGASDHVALEDLASQKILTKDGIDVIRSVRYDVLKHADDLRYYERLTRNGHALKPSGPTITTIHGSKGREADSVIVFPEASRRCWQDPDNEHRLAYVAATRSKRLVSICHERIVDWASAPYEYPTEVPVESQEG